MNITINDLKVDLPFDLKTRIYFRHRNKISKGKIRKIKTEIHGNTGYKNVHINLWAIVNISGKDHEFELGCFGRTEATARENTEARIIAIHASSGVSFPRKSRPTKLSGDGGWKP